MTSGALFLPLPNQVSLWIVCSLHVKSLFMCPDKKLVISFYFQTHTHTILQFSLKIILCHSSYWGSSRQLRWSVTMWEGEVQGWEGRLSTYGAGDIPQKHNEVLVRHLCCWMSLRHLPGELVISLPSFLSPSYLKFLLSSNAEIFSFFS